METEDSELASVDCRGGFLWSIYSLLRESALVVPCFCSGYPTRLSRHL